MAKLNFFFGLFLLLALCSSCDKDQEELQTPEVTQQDCLLSKVLDQNNVVLTEISYNNQNQYSSIVDHKYGNSYAFTYLNNKISAITHSYTKPQQVPFIQTLEVNAEGFLKQKTYSNPTTSKPELYFPYEYTADNKLERTGIYAKSLSGPDEHRTLETYQYYGNNVVKFTSVIFRNPTDTTISTLNYEYDNKANPFARFRNFSTSCWYWSDHNPIKVTRINYRTDGSIISQMVEGTWTQEYAANGLLMKTTYNPTDGSAPTILKYEYICH
jgi:hypothetical protein